MTPLEPDRLDAISRDFAARLQQDAPEWTNRSDADPGITLLDMFAFLTESLAFRAPLPERGSASIARLRAAVDRLGAYTSESSGALTRVHYFSGQVLGTDDFLAEQDYLRAKQRRLNRWVLGAGVIAGLAVTVDPASRDTEPIVSIEPGLAVAPDGEELVVDHPRSCRFTTALSNGYVTLRYAERAVAAVSVPGRSVIESSRIEERVAVDLAADVPTDGVAIARLQRSGSTWEVDRRFVAIAQSPRPASG